MAKGSNFERDICKLLSKWWTGGKRDDVFWRTAGSGARATQRAKRSQKTFGQYGDVQATDPVGQPLIDLCTIELKRGYSKSTFADLIEDSQTANAKPCMYAKFIEQAKGDSKKAGTPWWLLIVKRDRRKPIVIYPPKLFDMHWVGLEKARVFRPKKVHVYISPLLSFLDYVEPENVISCLEDEDCEGCTRPTCANCFLEKNKK